MSARRAIGSEVGIAAPVQELDREQFPIQDTGEVVGINESESNSKLDELVVLKAEFDRWSSKLRIFEATSNCKEVRFKNWLSRECCMGHVSIMKERNELIARAQKLTGDTRETPMSRADVSEDDPILFSELWFEKWEREFSK